MPRPWLARLLWLDGLSALAAGIFVLALRERLAELYAMPLDTVTVLGAVNLAYAAFGLGLAASARRPAGLVAALAAANGVWACACAALVVTAARGASVFAIAHLAFEGFYVAALGALEWRNRRALAGPA